MEAFELHALVEPLPHNQVAWQEFLRSPALSMGIYRLPVGSTDPQKPHSEDEVYLVHSGCGVIRVGSEDRPVQPGTLVYVPALVEHRFHSISQELTVLVCFAPAEYTNRKVEATTQASSTDFADYADARAVNL